jgi:hypothetical protein
MKHKQSKTTPIYVEPSAEIRIMMQMFASVYNGAKEVGFNEEQAMTILLNALNKFDPQQGS